MKKISTITREKRLIGDILDALAGKLEELMKSCQAPGHQYPGSRGAIEKVDIDEFKKLYAITSNLVLAKKYGITDSICCNIARKFSLKKDPQWRRLNCCFQPGHIPANKGIKGIHNSPATEFPKGHKPANTLYNGAIRLRYKHGEYQGTYIRIAPMKWILYNRFLWMKYHGPIPNGYLVARKDLNKPVIIDNLKLITMKENRIRNSGTFNLTDRFVAYSIAGKNNMHLVPAIMQNPRLLELKRKSILLKRSIHEKSN